MVVPRTQCISIIDESSPSTTTHFTDWRDFRNNFPNNNGEGREFWLLQPAGSRWDFNDLNRPSNFLNDSLANGTVGGGTFTVNRDDNVLANRSDWFAITNMASQPPGSYVSVWLDISGSMVYRTVQKSYEYFVERCNEAGINIILETSNSGERWIPGHNEYFSPSASFSTDPDFLTNFNQQNSVTIDYGGSATLSWIVFGDTTSASISGIGAVADPSGTITVSPAATTTYDLTATGPAGDTTRTVTVTVLPPPPPTVTFTADPTSYIRPGQTTLSWTVSGVSITDIDIDGGVGDVLPDTTFDENGVGTGSVIVNPTDTTTFSLTAKNFGGDQNSVTTKAVTITVYEPTVATIIAIPNPITVGQTASLEWSVTGDADEASIDPPVSATGEVLLSSSADVSPNVTTRYTLTANGPGGFDEAFVDLKVCQLPEISGSFPVEIDYGGSISVDVTFKNATTGATVLATYTNVQGSNTTETFQIGSTESDEDNTEVTVTFEPTIPWDDFGPERIIYQLSASGCGGTVFQAGSTINVNIDQLPDLFNLDPSLDKLPEEQVVAPEDDVVLSDPVIITDIDIPVEIKASEPIQVRFDNDDPNIEANWKDVRRIP